MFHVFHFLLSDMAFGIVNPFWWKTNAMHLQREKLPDFNAFPVSFNTLK